MQVQLRTLIVKDCFHQDLIICTRRIGPIENKHCHPTMDNVKLTLVAFLAVFAPLALARSTQTDTSRPTSVATAPVDLSSSSCDVYHDSRTTCRRSGAPDQPGCDTTPYWLAPCAGCVPAPTGVTHPGGWSTPPLTNPDLQCLLQQLQGIERNVKQYDTSAQEMRHVNMFMGSKSTKDVIDLAHKYNIPTNFKCRKGEDPLEWIRNNVMTFAVHWEETWKAENKVIAEVEDSCEISRAANTTRRANGDILCKLQIHLPMSSGSTVVSSPPSSASKTLTERKFHFKRFIRERVVVAYFKKFLRKAKRFIRKMMS